MSRGINKVTLIGHCGSDPETRYLPSGGAVTNVTLATSESWKDKQTGEKQERTEWHRLVFFNRLGEITGEYLKKGSKIYVEGSLRTQQWEKDGVKRYTTEIVVREMQMLDSRATGGESGGFRPSSAPSTGDQSNANVGDLSSKLGSMSDDDLDDDIPF